MNLNDREYTLYEKIGLENFAPSVDIEACQNHFEIAPEFDELRHSAICEDLRKVFAILGNAQTKAWYDLLLEGLQRNEKLLTPIADPSERVEIQRFAVHLGIHLVQRTETVLQIVQPDQQTGQPQSLSSSNRKFQLGESEIIFSAIPCKAQFSDYDDNLYLVAINQPGVNFPFQSEVALIMASQGDDIQIVSLGGQPGQSQLQAGYINQTQGLYAALEFAGQALFCGGKEDIAERLGTRARSDRIRELILEFYQLLAEAMSEFDTNVDAIAAASSFRPFAERVHADLWS